jgi:hypothetical protein
MSDNDEITKTVVDLSVRVNALRDVVSVLIALRAEQDNDPEVLLQRRSDALNRRVDNALFRGTQLSPGTEFLIERTRVQYDWMIAAAQSILGAGDLPDGQKGGGSP